MNFLERWWRWFRRRNVETSWTLYDSPIFWYGKGNSVAEQSWLLQDTPIFWFTGTPAPPPSGPGVLTVYDTGLFPGVGVNVEHIAPKLTPEQEQAIWRGDTRYYPGLLPEGPPR